MSYIYIQVLLKTNVLVFVQMCVCVFECVGQMQLGLKL